MRSKAQFRAERDRLGLSQADVADALGVDRRSVKRWEQPGCAEPPGDAWRLLDDYAALRDEAVSAALSQVASIVEGQGANPGRVVLTYYRSQADYDEHGRDRGFYGAVNATTRAVAHELAARGICVEYAYPGDGAIRTPGSGY